MKNKVRAGVSLSRRAKVLLIAAVYVFGMVAGCLIILMIPLYNHRADLLELAQERGEQVLEHYTLGDIPGFGTEFYLFDENKRLIISELHFLSAEERATIPEYLPEVFEKGQLYTTTTFMLESDTNQKCFGIVAGVRLESKTGNRFAALVLRDLVDLNISLETFAALYTLIFAAAVYLIMTVIKQHRELDTLRRDLIANVSHELKTPITSIRAMAEVIHDGLDRDEATRRKYSGAIMREADNLEKLVLDILSLAKMQSHKVDFKKSKAYAEDIFPPIIDRYMMMCTDLGISFDTSGLDLTAIPPLYTDAEHIEMLTNVLLDNAVKFTGSGGTIRLSQKLSYHNVTFCVEDNGPGIRKEDLDHIFDRFYKADVTHNSTGSGLGLAIADQIVQGLGEKLWVESTWGKGTAFYFTVGLK